MGSKTLYTEIKTTKPMSEVQDAMRDAFKSLGGTLTETPMGLNIKEGTNGVSFAFSASFDATANLRQINDENYELACSINWSLSVLSVLCLIIGFFVFGILWIVPLLYLFVNPTDAYQQVLNRIQILVR